MKRSRCRHVAASLAAVSNIFNGSVPSANVSDGILVPSQTAHSNFSSVLAIASVTPSLTSSAVIPSFTAQPTGSYALTRSMVGADFYDAFEFVTFDDPTNGRVNYVDQATAEAGNLTYVTSDNTLSSAATTKRWFNPRNVDVTGLFVLDVRHMPVGCGTWPAWWTNAEGEAWPAGGEIDIIEGTHGRGSGLQTLHTTEGCMQSANRTMTGIAKLPDCNAGNGGTGCGVSVTKAASFGASHNDIGGGWHIMRRSATEGISMWFFARNDPTVPASIANGADSVTEAELGVPVSTFVSWAQCDLPTSMKPHKFILNLTFCGGWGTQTYPSSCPASCDAHVDGSPEAFADAYWDVAGFRIYA